MFRVVFRGHRPMCIVCFGSVEEVDVITGDGRFLQNVSRTNEADLFHALSASYGTHAILTRVAVRLEPAPYVMWYLT
jgi:FAD/FMN-containing dehydrogenase